MIRRVSAALLPVAVLFWLLLSQRIPQPVRNASVDLSGEWSSPGDGRWLQRRFQLPSTLDRRNLFLMVDEPGSVTAELQVNESRVGSPSLLASSARGEQRGRQGWNVSQELLHPGENLLALRLSPQERGSTGLQEALLGTLTLKQAVLNASDSRRLAEYGSASLLLFLLGLLGFLLLAEEDPEVRGHYRSAAALLVAATAYLSASSGVFSPTLPLEWRTPLTSLLGVMASLAWVNCLAQLLSGLSSRGTRRLRQVHLALLGTLTLCAALSQVRLVQWVADLNLVYSVAMAWVLWKVGKRDLLGLSAVLFFAATGAADLLRELGVLRGLPSFPLGVAGSAMTAAAVLIARFTRLGLVNQEMGVSLKRTNGELADALVKAQEASRLKSEFVANVSHELRTPLNSVLNIPEGILEYFEPAPGARCEICTETFGLEPGEALAADTACPGCGARGNLVPEDTFRFRGEAAAAVRSLQQIHRAGNHLLNLINDVLDFSRLEAGKMVLKLEPLDVSTALGHALETIEPICRPRKITLTLEPVQGGPLVCDSVKFSQIFINLVGNAVKFSPEGGEVRIGGELRDGKWLLRVKDQGIGIAPEHHEVIFESFRQVDGSNTRKYGGTGLGLAITRKLAEAHGGRVWVESAPEQGSTFCVELPCEGPLVKAVEEVRLDGPVATILLLDDEPLAIDNLKAALRPLRHRIHGIINPADLDRALAEIQPGLLVLDVMMPGVSGLDILKRLKATHSTLPVLVSSAYHANHDVVDALGAAWLSKPWRGDVLRAEVTRLLRSNHRSEEGPRRVAS